MKKILIFASLLLFVFAVQSWATDRDQGHPWEGDRGMVVKVAGPDGDAFVFTIPSVVMDMITPLMSPDGVCPDNCEYVCGWIFTNEHGWVFLCQCNCYHLK